MGIQIRGSDDNISASDGSLTINGASFSTLQVNGQNLPTAGPLSNRNLIINGAMQVAQRGTTITDVGVDTFTLDRWRHWASVGGQAGRSTATQETITDLEGFRTALKLQVTTTETPAANEVYGLNTRLELQDISGLDIGGSNSKSLTLSFWAKAPTGNGTFCAGIFMSGGGHYVEEVTIGTTWSRHIINIPATTTSSHATTQTVNANIGMEIQITLMAGDNHDNSTNGAWGSGTGNRATSNQSNFYSSTSNNLWITGVQLEVGSVATPFERRSYGQELLLCQRYFVNQNWIFCKKISNLGYRYIPPGPGVVMRTSADMAYFNPDTGTANQCREHSSGTIYTINDAGDAISPASAPTIYFGTSTTPTYDVQVRAHYIAEL